MAQSRFKHFYLFLNFFLSILGLFQQIISPLQTLSFGGVMAFALKRGKPVIYSGYITRLSIRFYSNSKPNSFPEYVFGLFVNVKDNKHF